MDQIRKEHYLIVLDCDGTLLTSENTIMPKTKDYLLKLQKEGHIITMASGRPDRAVLPYHQELGCKGPFIANNGALIIHPYDPSFPTFKKQFSKEVIKDFLSHFDLTDFSNLVAEDDEYLYFLREDPSYENFFHTEGRKILIGDMTKRDYQDLSSLIITLYDSSLAEKILNLASSYDDLSFRFWDEEKTIGELYFKSVNKATSIDKLREYYHLDKDHVIVFGDGENDIEMLSSFKNSYAMKNGSSYLKQVASHITREDNNHEGIYIELKDFFEGDN